MLSSHLIPTSRFAIAFSGGGDSTALVHMLRDENPLVLIVDHGLRAGSNAEALKAQVFAKGLGLEAKVLTWTHNNPTTGLQEKARRARYSLMGAACRAAGLKYVLTGHTEDDQAETLLMRYARGTNWRGAAGMGSRVYAPLWPALADITLVRPLITASRQDLRAYNTAHGLTWIEDPSNQNLDFTRIRARQYLRTRPVMRADLLSAASDLRAGLVTEKDYLAARFKQCMEIDDWGNVYVKSSVPTQLLKHILRAASGTGGPIDTEKLEALKRRMFEPDFKAATLADALVIRHKDKVLVGPDPARIKGRFNRGPLPPMRVRAHHPAIWDGRYVITTHRDDVTVKALHTHQSSLSKSQRDRLKPLAPKFRISVPLVQDSKGDLLCCPQVTSHSDIECIPIVASRLHAILGIETS